MKKIVIMGASSGIGRRVAELLMERGVRIGIAARRTEALEEMSHQYPGLAEYASIDICSQSASAELYDLISRLGGMDIYLHAAGRGSDTLPLNAGNELHTLTTNVDGFTRMIIAAYQYFLSSGIRGRIAAITSVASTRGIGTMAAYSASKSFQTKYIEALAQLAMRTKAGIRFTDLRPGWVETPLLPEGSRYFMQMDTEYAARRIIKALAKGENVCTFDWRWRIMADIWKHLPRAVWIRTPLRLSGPLHPFQR